MLKQQHSALWYSSISHCFSFLSFFGLFTKTVTTRSGQHFLRFSAWWCEHILKACRGPLGPKTPGSTKAPHTARGHWGSGLKILNLGLLSHFGDSVLRTRPAFLPLRLLALTDGFLLDRGKNKRRILSHVVGFFFPVCVCFLPLPCREPSGGRRGAAVAEESRKRRESSPDENPKSACLAAAAEASAGIAFNLFS